MTTVKPLTTFNNIRTQFENLFELAAAFGLHRQDMDLAQLEAVSFMRQSPAAYHTQDAQVFVAAAIIKALENSDAQSPLLPTAFANPDDTAIAAASGYPILAGILMGQVSLKQIPKLHVSILQKHRSTLRHFIRQSLFADKLHDVLENAMLPDQMMQWHHDRLNVLFNKVLANPRLFQSIRRILAYQGRTEPYPRFLQDLNLVHKTVSQVLNGIRPKLIFNDSRSNILGGTAGKTIIQGVDMVKDGWRHDLYNTVQLRDTNGTRLSGANILERVLHELLHSKEEVMLERIMGKANAKMADKQRRYFSQNRLDEWPFKEMAVMLALNSSILGRYVGVNEDPKSHYNQFRERHARWFAAQTSLMLKECITQYAPLHAAYKNPQARFKVLEHHITSFLQNAPERLAAYNPFMPPMADICKALGLVDIAQTLKGGSPALMQKTLQDLNQQIQDVLNPQDLRPDVPDNRTDWALKFISSFCEDSLDLLARMQNFAPDQPQAYTPTRPFDKISPPPMAYMGIQRSRPSVKTNVLTP